jgi:protein TonB
MTARAEAHIAFPALPSPREIGLWALAGLVVISAHAAIAYYVSTRPPELAAEASEPAMMIDLAPLPVQAPQEVEPENLVEEQPNETIEPVDEVQTEMAETPVEEPVQPDEVEPVETPEEVAEAEPEEAEEIAPEIAEAITPEVAVPLPQPRPVVREQPKKPVEKKKEVVKKQEKPAPKKDAEVAEKETTVQKRVVQRAVSTAPKVSPARWQSKLFSWINRHKRKNSTGDTGVARITMRIDASGNVLSARLSGSTGNAELDQEAVALILRSSPVPAPPEPAFAKRPIVIPIEFKRR